MGHGFGELYKLRGIVTFALSPFEQRAYAYAFTKGVSNMMRRIAESVLYVAPPLLMVVGVYNFMEDRHEQLKRKNPKDYEDEE